MPKYPPYPLPSALVEAIKSTYGLETDEEACQPAVARDYIHKTFAITYAPKVEKQDLVIEHNGIKVDISIIRPLESSDKVLPVMMYLHGGGWVVGSYETHCGLTNILVDRLSCCVVFVNYSLSPEVKYPVALEECHATLGWMKENADLIYIDYKSVVVAGDSAGGNLAAALPLYEKARGNFDISYQILLYPIVDDNFETESYIENKDNIILPPSSMYYVWEVYPDKAEHREEITMAPLKSTLEELKGIAPAFIVSAEKDVLRSETEAYASKLIEANVPTVAVRYIGVNHGFLTEAVLGPQAQVALSQIADVLKRHWGLKDM